MSKTPKEYTATMPALRRALGKLEGGAPAAAIALNIPVRRLRAYRDGHCEVPSATLAAMFGLLGESFENDWRAEHGLPLITRQTDATICPREANATIAAANHGLADALVDGHVDHREAASLLPAIDKAAAIIPMLAKTLRKVRAAA
jgi:hypothetical protein